MTKIGILTFHWANNFGAIIQAWSLNKLLINMGYEAEVINFLPNLHLINEQIVKPWQLALKYRIQGYPLAKGTYFSIREATEYILDLNNKVRKNHSFDNFRKHYIKVSSRTINKIEELKRECLKYDICLIGSDQVWNPRFLRFSDYAYLLPFNLEGVKKIAFSVSLGVSSIPPAMVKLYKTAISDFSFISLREKTHLSALSSITGKRIYHTVDPTLLVGREFLETIMNKKDVLLPYDEYILVYNLTLSMLPLAEKIVHMLKLPVIVYKRPSLIEQKLTFSKRLRYELTLSQHLKKALSFSFASPGEFLVLLKNAKFMITNSYHGTVLSILFKKPFISIVDELTIKQASRIFDLLELLGLRERLFVSKKKTLEIMNKPIDYDHVTSLISNARRESLELLKIALRG